MAEGLRLVLIYFLPKTLKKPTRRIDEAQKYATPVDSFFKKTQGIDFRNIFFHASVAERVRIRNVLKTLVGLPGVSDAATRTVAYFFYGIITL